MTPACASLCTRPPTHASALPQAVHSGTGTHTHPDLEPQHSWGQMEAPGAQKGPKSPLTPMRRHEAAGPADGGTLLPSNGRLLLLTPGVSHQPALLGTLQAPGWDSASPPPLPVPLPVPTSLTHPASKVSFSVQCGSTFCPNIFCVRERPTHIPGQGAERTPHGAP